MYNNSDTEYNIKCGDCIAQMVTYNIAHPIPIEASHLQPTQRGPNGFGSTGTSTPVVRQATVPSALQATTVAILNEDGIKPYNIWLSGDPFQS